MAIISKGDKMRKQYWILILLVLFLVGIGIYFLFTNTKQSNLQTADYTTNRTEVSINTSEKENTNTLNIGINSENNTNKPKPVETEIAKYTTKIYTKDSSRQKNISITCSTLNDTLIENGSTFSFCNTVGQATTSKGYEKAEIFDANRKHKTWTWWWKLSNKYNSL